MRLNKVVLRYIQDGSNMTGTDCVKKSHSLSPSYLNHLVHGTSRKEVTRGEWTQLHSEELPDLYELLNKHTRVTKPGIDRRGM
jgi:hypothetical protein